MTPLVVGLSLVAILIVIVALIIIFTTRREKSCVNREKYQKRWLSIQGLFKKDNPSSYQLAIIKADKLLDSALKERCFSGKTCMERIKSAKSSWQNAQSLVSAHRLRNQIVHEEEVNLSYDEARRALASFKQGLRDIGAI